LKVRELTQSGGDGGDVFDKVPWAADIGLKSGGFGGSPYLSILLEKNISTISTPIYNSLKPKKLAVVWMY
tara:strand:- start:1378 stop:1587 length:210 start_codon:yes stop_codon:yes gene_type:complete